MCDCYKCVNCSCENIFGEPSCNKDLESIFFTKGFVKSIIGCKNFEAK